MDKQWHAYLLKAGHPVILSNSKGPDSLKEIVTSMVPVQKERYCRMQLMQT